jgi:hypothetical protein
MRYNAILPSAKVDNKFTSATIVKPAKDRENTFVSKEAAIATRMGTRLPANTTALMLHQVASYEAPKQLDTRTKQPARSTWAAT